VDWGRLTVQTSLAAPGTVKMAMSDTGVGLPVEMLPRIFDPFFTTKTEGLGISLPIIFISGHADLPPASLSDLYGQRQDRRQCGPKACPSVVIGADGRHEGGKDRPTAKTEAIQKCGRPARRPGDDR